MRYIKVLLLGFSALALSVGVAGAGLNPLNPGLAGGTAVYKPTASRICVDCHTRVPGASANNGTHFVTAGTTTADTRSGGGWGTALTDTFAGVREGGQYFRVSQWLSGAYSKYGRASDNSSMIFATVNDNTGVGTSDMTKANFATYEMICESCHSVIKNVAGGNNLVAPMTGAHVLSSGTVNQASPYYNSDEATLCVGCHGFMYTDNVTTPQQPRYADTRNMNDVNTGRKGNNHIHFINGSPRSQNHHVMTADRIESTQAAVGLYWADTLVKDTSPSGWPSGSEVITTTYTAGTRGQMPIRGPKAERTLSTTAAQLNCLHCHAAPHSGNLSTGASILRATTDLQDSNSATGTNKAIARLGEASRTWMGFVDKPYCNDCHGLK